MLWSTSYFVINWIKTFISICVAFKNSWPHKQLHKYVYKYILKQEIAITPTWKVKSRICSYLTVSYTNLIEVCKSAAQTELSGSVCGMYRHTQYNALHFTALDVWILTMWPSRAEPGLQPGNLSPHHHMSKSRWGRPTRTEEGKKVHTVIEKKSKHENGDTFFRET